MTRSSLVRVLVAAVVVGAATGLRSQSGLVAVTRSTDPGLLPRPFSWPILRRRGVLLAGAEAVVDKLPFAPPRTAPSALVPRGVLGAISAGLLARRARRGIAVPAVLGALSAVAAAHAGTRSRLAAARRVPALVAGLVEDAVATGLAMAAVRVGPGRAQ